MDSQKRNLSDGSDAGVQATDWTKCDWHGVWVHHKTTPGSYGRIAYRAVYPEGTFMVRWTRFNKSDKRESGNYCSADELQLLPVKPKPWF